MKLPKPQQKQSLDPKDYEIVCVVFGSRYWNDRKYFHEKIMEFIEDQEGKEILFVSGAAKSGADDLIIRWCAKFGFPCLRMPADWNNEKGRAGFNPRTAGFVRNEEMSCVANQGISFWDHVTVGTGDMVERCEHKKIPLRIYRIPVQPKPQRRMPDPED